MTSIRSLKLISAAALTASLLSACSIAPKFTPEEKEAVRTMDAGQFHRRTQEDREAIETQPLFAQAAFWSREYDLSPADLEAALKLSSALRRLGNPQQALEIAQTTRALYPRDTNLVAEYAANLIALEQGKEAIASLSTAVRQEPNNPRLWSLLGASHDQIAQYGRAREFYNRALSMTPNDSNILANVGLSYALEGDARTAEIWLRRASEDPYASAHVRQNLALVLGLQGKYSEAENLARQDMSPEGAENNVAYLRSMKGGTRSYEALANPGANASRTPPAPRTASPARSASRSSHAAPRQLTQPRPQARAFQKAANPSAPRIYGSTSPVQPQAQSPHIARPAHNSLPPSRPNTTVIGSGSARDAAMQAARNMQARKTQTLSAPSQNQSQQQKDILAQIGHSLNGKTAPQRPRQLTGMAQQKYAQEQSKRQAQQHAQHSGMRRAPQQAQNPNVQIQTYGQPAQQTQNQAQAPNGYPQRRPALRRRN